MWPSRHGVRCLRKDRHRPTTGRAVAPALTSLRSCAPRTHVGEAWFARSRSTTRDSRARSATWKATGNASPPKSNVCEPGLARSDSSSQAPTTGTTATPSGRCCASRSTDTEGRQRRRCSPSTVTGQRRSRAGLGGSGRSPSARPTCSLPTGSGIDRQPGGVLRARCSRGRRHSSPGLRHRAWRRRRPQGHEACTRSGYPRVALEREVGAAGPGQRARSHSRMAGEAGPGGGRATAVGRSPHEFTFGVSCRVPPAHERQQPFFAVRYHSSCARGAVSSWSRLARQSGRCRSMSRLNRSP